MNEPFSKILHYSGCNALARKFLDDKIYVLNYHSVSSEANSEVLQASLYSNLSIDAGLFEKHMRFLKKNGHTFVQFRDLLGTGVTKCKKPTIIYFDDGYKDNLENARPILKRLDISACVSISPALVDRTDILWTIKYRVFVRSSNMDIAKGEATIEHLKTLSKNDREEEVNKLYSLKRFELLPENLNIYGLERNFVPSKGGLGGNVSWSISSKSTRARGC